MNFRDWTMAAACAALCAACDGEGAPDGGLPAEDAADIQEDGASAIINADAKVDASGNDASSTEHDAGASAVDAGMIVMGPDIPVGPALADGQVIAPWDKFCIATFTRDFVAYSGSVPLLEIQMGDRYLLGPDFGLRSIIYIGDNEGADVNIQFGDAGVPFTSSCADVPGEGVGVFADTTVYEDKELTRALCVVQAGQLLPGKLEYTSGGGNFWVRFEGLAKVCGGKRAGYVRLINVQLPVGRPWPSWPFIPVALPTM